MVSHSLRRLAGTAGLLPAAATLAVVLAPGANAAEVDGSADIGVGTPVGIVQCHMEWHVEMGMVAQLIELP